MVIIPSVLDNILVFNTFLNMIAFHSCLILFDMMSLIYRSREVV